MAKPKKKKTTKQANIPNSLNPNNITSKNNPKPINNNKLTKNTSKVRRKGKRLTARRGTRKHKHPEICILCQHPDRKAIEKMFVNHFTEDEIAAAHPDIMAENGNGDGIRRYKSLDCLRLGLVNHASYTGLDERKLNNITGMNRRLIQKGFGPVFTNRIKSPKAMVKIAEVAMNREYDLAVSMYNANAAAQNAGSNTLVMVEQSDPNALLELVAKGQKLIEGTRKQLPNKTETVDEQQAEVIGGDEDDE